MPATSTARAYLRQVAPFLTGAVRDVLANRARLEFSTKEAAGETGGVESLERALPAEFAGLNVDDLLRETTELRQRLTWQVLRYERLVSKRQLFYSANADFMSWLISRHEVELEVLGSQYVNGWQAETPFSTAVLHISRLRPMPLPVLWAYHIAARPRQPGNAVRPSFADSFADHLVAITVSHLHYCVVEQAARDFGDAMLLNRLGPGRVAGMSDALDAIYDPSNLGLSLPAAVFDEAVRLAEVALSAAALSRAQSSPQSTPRPALFIEDCVHSLEHAGRYPRMLPPFSLRCACELRTEADVSLTEEGHYGQHLDIWRQGYCAFPARRVLFKLAEQWAENRQHSPSAAPPARTARARAVRRP